MSFNTDTFTLIVAILFPTLSAFFYLGAAISKIKADIHYLREQTAGFPDIIKQGEQLRAVQKNCSRQIEGISQNKREVWHAINRIDKDVTGIKQQLTDIKGVQQ